MKAQHKTPLSTQIYLLISIAFAVLVFGVNATDNPARVLGYVSTPFVLAAIGVAIYRTLSDKARQKPFVDQFAKVAFWLTILNILSRLGQAT